MGTGSGIAAAVVAVVVAAAVGCRLVGKNSMGTVVVVVPAVQTSAAGICMGPQPGRQMGRHR